MPVALSRNLISLNLTPMQIPEAVPDGMVQHVGTTALVSNSFIPTGINLNLLLHPGEPSEMIVQLSNMGNHGLRVSLYADGDFPQLWCRMGSGNRDQAPMCQIGLEDLEIPARHRIDLVLTFTIAADFFEAPDTVHPEQTLRLNYQGYLHIHCTDLHTGRRQVETANFRLLVRPRSLYLDFLPAIYREIDFVGRFLKIFEQGFEPTVQILDLLWAYLDPLTAPQTMLPFLAHWVGWDLQRQIGLQRQRHLIRNALQIYRWRGTRQGLRFYLHLATGLPLDDHVAEEAEKHIGIQEFFSQGCILGVARLGEDAILGGGRPFHFTVHLRCPEPEELDESLVRRVIEQEKPAFCTYDLVIEQRTIQYVPLLLSAATD